jgi:hypothetical protein
MPFDTPEEAFLFDIQHSAGVALFQVRAAAQERSRGNEPMEGLDGAAHP